MSNLELQKLGRAIKGEFYSDNLMRKIYATDASAYKELPLAVAIPREKRDIQILIEFAAKHGLSLIPRTAGTSLAGQVVGAGIVVDVSKYFTQILEVNTAANTVTVEPGVIRDELNLHLAEQGLFFGPETSTANRAMIGGMIGNNSCGSNSVVYGATRDHLLEVEAFLSDGSLVTFGALTEEEFEDKRNGKNVVSSLEQSIYQEFYSLFNNSEVINEIEEAFPKPNIERRNTGYAVDMMVRQKPFNSDGKPFNFCSLLAGSEGTLAFITQAKFSVNPLPPKYSSLLCIHFESIFDSLKGNLVALEFDPYACELMDHFILERTKSNINQSKNRFFVKGDPKAILVVELKDEDQSRLQQRIDSLIEKLKKEKLGYHFPVVSGSDTKRVWTLRKAGLGLLSNIPGDAKPAPVIEDTAVDVQDLPEYIMEFNAILDKHNMSCVHYAHAGSGELHLRPVLNLKTKEGNAQFRKIAEEIASLVKKYKGSLSGEHGDGRLRGEFIPFMVGEENYARLQRVKSIWDPNSLFNPGKIVDAPPMDSALRFEPGHQTPEFQTAMDFTESQGMVRAAELCNGSGDCRKTHLSGGTMCPSYMATKNEKDTTRARANIIREVLNDGSIQNKFNAPELKEALDLCLSCKACKSECPSNVDMAKLKAETLYQGYKQQGVPFRVRMIANFNRISKLGALLPGVYNFIVRHSFTGGILKKINGFAPDRSLPLLHQQTLRHWYKHNKANNFGINKREFSKKVYLFCDEFTNYNDTQVGITAIKLLTKLGVEVIIPKHEESGRTYLSKGLLKEAKAIAEKNVTLLTGKIEVNTPLIGLEPSAILSFRDEYPDLLLGEQKAKAKAIAANVKTIEEYFEDLIESGFLSPNQFNASSKTIKIHGHCHQKALSSLVPSRKMLGFPKNYTTELIPSGCCGMAGSFGYEKEHYSVSMQTGELVLFPAVRSMQEGTVVAAAGTSCRHQILDGTGVKSKHPVEILYEALL